MVGERSRELISTLTTSGDIDDCFVESSVQSLHVLERAVLDAPFFLLQTGQCCLHLSLRLTGFHHTQRVDLFETSSGPTGMRNSGRGSFLETFPGWMPEVWVLGYSCDVLVFDDAGWQAEQGRKGCGRGLGAVSQISMARKGGFAGSERLFVLQCYSREYGEGNVRRPIFGRGGESRIEWRRR